MFIIIICITIAIYILGIVWNYKMLGDMISKSKKIAIIITEILVAFIITIITFNISKKGIYYNNTDIEQTVRNILVAIFASLNFLAFTPFISKTISKIYEGEIEKEQFLKRIALISVIFLVCIFFETGYMADTQEGILKIYEAKK